MIRNNLKGYRRIAKKTIISNSLLRGALLKFGGNYPRIFLYHRFSAAMVYHPNRVSANEFGWQLDQISKRFKILSLGESLQHYNKQGNWPEKCVILTIDDGYRDFYEFAFQELKQRSLTATLFVTVNFVDKRIWLWPDRLYYAIKSTEKAILCIKIKKQYRTFNVNNDIGKCTAWKTINDYCISVADHEKESLITKIETDLGVDMPKSPPAGFQAVTWEELAEMHDYGIEIGSHTMNHPILSRISPERSKNEIKTSRTVLEQKLRSPVRTFCYPNGMPEDVNDSVIKQVLKAGYIGAVLAKNLRSWNPYLLPRFGCSNDRIDFMWKLYGGEVLWAEMGRIH